MRIRVLLSVAVLATVTVAMTSTQALEGKAKRTYLYIHDNPDTAQVFGFSVEKNGGLAPLAGSPFVTLGGSPNCGGDCQSIAYSQRRKMLFHGTTNGLVAWSVGADGVLTEVGGSPFDLGATGGIYGVTVYDKGKSTYVYGAQNNADVVSGYSIAADGTPTELAGSPYPAGESAIGLDRAKKVITCANQTSSTLTTYKIGKGGELAPAPGNPVTDSLGDTYNAHTERKGKFLFRGGGSGSVGVYRINKKNGDLDEITGSPFVSGLGDAKDGVASLKKGLAVAIEFSGNGTNDVRTMRVSKKGVLTMLGAGPQSTGVNRIGTHDESPDGKFFAVAGDDIVKTFAVDKKTGDLEELDSSPLAGTNFVRGMAIIKR